MVIFKTVDVVTFTEEIIHGKLHFLCSEISGYYVRHLEEIALIL